ncbi:MAG: nicotinamide riboside transporter PnuC [Burkholderiaceae bacterium]|jgi:nicotinamide mononucleotide transporter
MLSLEWLAAGLGLLGVVLGLRENIWVWPFFIASSAIYLAIYLRLNLIGQAVLMLVFILTSAWGLWNWRQSRERSPTSTTQGPGWLRRAQRAYFLLAVVVLSLGFFIWFSSVDQHPNPWLDAIVTSVSLVAMALMGMKRIDCWLAWLFANAASVVLFLQQSLLPTAALYFIQFGLAYWGLRLWTQRQAS